MPGKEPEDYRPRRAADADPAVKSEDAGNADPTVDVAPTDPVDPDGGTGGADRSSSGRRDPGRDGPTATLPPSRGGRRPPAGRPAANRTRGWVLGPRARQLLMIAGVVAVVIAGLVFGYFALRVGQQPDQPGPGGGATPTAGGRETPVSPVLEDAAMINAEGAAKIDPQRTWQVASTQRGLDSSSPRPACLTGELADGQPNPQQVVLRVVSGGGRNAPAVLHEATAYATSEDAAQALAVLTKTIGGCAVAGAYVDSGRAIGGVGDQAAGVVVQLGTGRAAQFRTVVLARTGGVVNVVDVAQTRRAAPARGIAQALADVVAVQCTTSGGACAADVTVTTAPPPLGGDEPGFLAAGDLPPVGRNAPAWVGDPVHTPSPDFTGSQCENVDWSKVQAKERAARTYLQQDSPQPFGLDEIVITTESARAAGALVDKVRDDLESCEERKLTASVAKFRRVRGEGAENAEIQGWTTVVRQRSTTGTATYRVGMVSVGNKAIYLFLNPIKNLDLSTGQFHRVAVRAGQRASQVS